MIKLIKEEGNPLERHLFDVASTASKHTSHMEVVSNMFLTAQPFYEYTVDILGSVAACVTVAYSDAKLLAGVKTAYMRETQKIKNTVAMKH